MPPYVFTSKVSCEKRLLRILSYVTRSVMPWLWGGTLPVTSIICTMKLSPTAKAPLKMGIKT